jgi:putative component of toxin-antitoxin plasmid stabilization module
MYTIKPLPQFTKWLDDLKDVETRAFIAARIKRLECGLMGDVK